MIRVLKCLVLLALLSRITPAADRRDWTPIAGVGGIDKITQIHVSNLLASNGIISVMGGSLLYTVEVPSDKAEDASKVLHRDALKLRYNIWLATNNVFATNGVVTADEGKRKQLISGSAVSSVLQQKAFDSSTALGRFLRSKEISELLSSYPYIVSLFVLERQYLATPKTYGIGYDVRIELKKSPEELAFNYRGYYQVYDGGNEVKFLGSEDQK